MAFMASSATGKALAMAGITPGQVDCVVDAIDFWDITNRQDWQACESVQRGLSFEHAKPGPLSPDEDAVYQFVTMIGRGYLGEPAWNHSAAAVVS